MLRAAVAAVIVVVDIHSVATVFVAVAVVEAIVVAGAAELDENAMRLVFVEIALLASSLMDRDDELGLVV